MSKFQSRKVMPRYLLFAGLLTLAGVCVVAKAAYVMTVKKDFWEQVAKKKQPNSKPDPARRGNILSCDGQLMASSLPDYKLYIDFQPGKQRGVPPDTAAISAARKLDKLWTQKLDTICLALHSMFPSWSQEQFRQHLQKGRYKVNADKSVGSRYWLIWPRSVDYNTYKKVAELPIFCLPTNKGGFWGEETNSRQHPFGSLAVRTLGDVYALKDSAKNGIELAYDSILRGVTGQYQYRRVLNKNAKCILQPKVDGADIVTTIDVKMQDLAERALLDEMRDSTVNADMGVAIVMECATGDVKAIVNMERNSKGNYYEAVNRAVSYRCEPGSVFKVASFLVALDDGVCDTSEIIHTGCGVVPIHNRNMKDHNWRRGGYGDITFGQSIAYSSNIGVSHIIGKYYGNNEKRYVDGLYRVGIAADLKLPIKGYNAPWVRYPDKKTTNRQKYWSSTTLAWMSIGYETQIAPINTVAFYNAIANGGCLYQPRFVKAVQKNGMTIEEFPPVVLRQQIARPEAVKQMQELLRGVVTYGTGKKLRNANFPLAGKTGTAQIADEHGGYHSGTTRYWLSFAGFFPADNPMYTCIVCLRKRGTPASGTMSAQVFKNIAEGVMSQYVKSLAKDARDSTSIMVPDVKNGNLLAADYVLAQLGVRTDGGWNGSYAEGNPVWGHAARQQNGVQLTQQTTAANIMPDVTGMGARDAVYLLEKRGVRVHLNGAGRVRRQSVPFGHAITTGMSCELTLE